MPFSDFYLFSVERTIVDSECHRNENKDMQGMIKIDGRQEVAHVPRAVRCEGEFGLRTVHWLGDPRRIVRVPLFDHGNLTHDPVFKRLDTG